MAILPRNLSWLVSMLVSILWANQMVSLGRGCYCSKLWVQAVERIKGRPSTRVKEINSIRMLEIYDTWSLMYKGTQYPLWSVSEDKGDHLTSCGAQICVETGREGVQDATILTGIFFCRRQTELLCGGHIPCYGHGGEIHHSDGLNEGEYTTNNGMHRSSVK